MSGSSFRNIVAWKQARKLVRIVYQTTDSFPAREIYVLSSQMRRAALSVPANIAEGDGRLSLGEWQQFLGQARGSLLELESHLIIAYDLKYAIRAEIKPVADLTYEVLKLINAMLRGSQKGFSQKKFKPLPAIR
jgi:four helix bundle protein